MTTETTPSDDAPSARVASIADPPKRRSVLVVDDEPLVRRMVSQLLTAAGYDVALAVDGVDLLEQYENAALACWPQAPFAVILSDVDMPRRDGFEAIRELRARNITTPVILMSGRFDKSFRESARSMGAADILPKPFELSDLSAAVSSVVACASEATTARPPLPRGALR